MGQNKKYLMVNNETNDIKHNFNQKIHSKQKSIIMFSLNSVSSFFFFFHFWSIIALQCCVSIIFSFKFFKLPWPCLKILKRKKFYTIIMYRCLKLCCMRLKFCRILWRGKGGFLNKHAWGNLYANLYPCHLGIHKA